MMGQWGSRRAAYRWTSIEVTQIQNGVTAELASCRMIIDNNAYGMNPPWNVALASQQRPIYCVKMYLHQVTSSEKRGSPVEEELQS